MKKKILILLVAVFLVATSTVSAKEGQWKFDKSNSNVLFSIKHMVISEVNGQFKTFDGALNVKNDDFSNTDVEFTIDANSITTGNDGRDKHLKSDDFFNTEKFPQIKFKSKSFTKTAEGKYLLTGDLTIRDITKEVQWEATLGGTVAAWGGKHTAFKVTGQVNRFDYDLKWNATVETGGLVAGDIVTITANIELVQKQEETKTK